MVCSRNSTTKSFCNWV